jgi:hypothetical protein
MTNAPDAVAHLDTQTVRLPGADITAKPCAPQRRRLTALDRAFVRDKRGSDFQSPLLGLNLDVVGSLAVELLLQARLDTLGESRTAS